MKIDFEEQFGVNAGYVEDRFEQWRANPAGVDEEWALWFTSMAAEAGTKVNMAAAESVAKPESKAVKSSEKDTSELPESTDAVEVEPLRGMAAAIARNMNASLEVPTATSVRICRSWKPPATSR